LLGPLDFRQGLFGVVLWYLQDQTLRFSELNKVIVTIYEKVLIRELREIEEAGIITRKVYAEVLFRLESSLTEFGKSITTLMSKIGKFGELYAQRFDKVIEHPSQQ
jgi:DNA-binding HxlR family transcriptional regulator